MIKYLSSKVVILPLRDEMSLALFRYRLACSGAADTDIITDVATATAISSTADEEIIVNLLSVLI